MKLSLLAIIAVTAPLLYPVAAKEPHSPGAPITPVPGKKITRAAESWPEPPDRAFYALAQVEAAQPVTPVPPPSNRSSRLERVVVRDQVPSPREFGRNAGKTLVVNTTKPNPENISEIEEDLVIMSRILDKTVDAKSNPGMGARALGIALSALPGGKGAQNIYLEGYGVLFTLNVRFPLAPSEVKTSEKPSKEPGSTWEQTRKEIYGGGSGDGGAWMHLIKQEVDFGPMEYDAEKVEELKKGLVEALKNASHIRHLKSDDQIVLAVQGPESHSGGTPKRVLHGSFGDYRPSSPESKGSRNSTLTLRAKKSEVDDFAKGKLNFDDFQKKVSITLY